MKKLRLLSAGAVTAAMLLETLPLYAAAAEGAVLRGGVDVPDAFAAGRDILVRGTVQSADKLTSVTAGIYDAQGKEICVAAAKPGTESYELGRLEDEVHFDTLPVGDYVYRVTASTAAQELIELDSQSFSVWEAQPVEALGVQNAPALPSTIRQNENLMLGGLVVSPSTIEEIYVSVMRADGSLAMTAISPGGSTSYDLARLNKFLPFRKLARGSYSIRITASNAEKKDQTILSHYFRIGNGAVPGRPLETSATADTETTSTEATATTNSTETTSTETTSTTMTTAATTTEETLTNPPAPGSTTESSTETTTTTSTTETTTSTSTTTSTTATTAATTTEETLTNPPAPGFTTETTATTSTTDTTTSTSTTTSTTATTAATSTEETLTNPPAPGFTTESTSASSTETTAQSSTEETLTNPPAPGSTTESSTDTTPTGTSSETTTETTLTNPPAPGFTTESSTETTESTLTNPPAPGSTTESTTASTSASSTETTMTNPPAPGSTTETTATTQNADKLTLTGGSVIPTQLNQGQAVIVRGTVSSASSAIRSVSVGIYDAAGTRVTGGSASPNTTSYDLKALDASVRFDLLADGVYTYRVYASNAGGTDELLDSQTFAVGNATVPAGDSITLTGGTTIPATLSSGQAVIVNGTVNSGSSNLTSVIVAIVNASGVRVIAASAQPNARSYNIHALDSAITFNKLTPGEYTFQVIASNASNTDQVINSQKFTVSGQTGFTYVNGILVVNKSYSVPATYNPGGLLPEVQAAFARMSAAARDEAGLRLWVYSGFRSYDRQSTIYNNYVGLYGRNVADTFSARPGHSEHQTGMAIDVNCADDSFIGTPEAIWLANNSYKYGFIIRYPQGKQNITGFKYEPWHVRYLGVYNATAVYQSGLTLEEYLKVDSVYR